MTATAGDHFALKLDPGRTACAGAFLFDDAFAIPRPRMELPEPPERARASDIETRLSSDREPEGWRTCRQP